MKKRHIRMVNKTTIPADSLVEQFHPADYTDACLREVVSEKALSPDDIMIGFTFSSSVRSTPKVCSKTQ